MTKKYFLFQDSGEVGPFEAADIVAMSAAGTIDGTAWVREAVDGSAYFACQEILNPPEIPKWQPPQTVPPPLPGARPSSFLHAMSVALGILGFFGGGLLAFGGFLCLVSAKTAMHETTAAIYLSVGFSTLVLAPLLSIACINVCRR